MWRAFLADYTPTILQLSRVYLPGAVNPEQLWKDALRAVSDDTFSVLRGFERQSEREFLSGLREFHLKRSSAALDPSRDAKDFPEPAVASMTALFKGVPLVRQEVSFLKLAGYSDATLEKIFRITPAVAQSSLGSLKEGYADALGKQTDEGLHPASWLKMLCELWAAKTEACPPLRLFIRIQDGQIGWQEKEPAEKHITGCLHCLERWTALKELAYWRRAAQPTPAAQVEELLSVLPVHEGAKRQKSLFSRLFG